MTQLLASMLIWVPIIGGAALLALSGKRQLAEIMAIAIAAVSFILSVVMWLNFDAGTHAMQFVQKLPWVESLGVNYHIGVDGVALPLILLTTISTLLVTLLVPKLLTPGNNAACLSAFLILEGLMVGVFTALDAILFYVFWEAMLIPMFLIIGVWGGQARVRAAIKFFLYTFLGSVFMLLALIYLAQQAGSYDISDFYGLELGGAAQSLIFIAFILAFAVKIPMWPVHTWLPEAHVEAPVGGSVILAAIMLKMGGYGLLRFALPIAPEAAASFAWPLIILSLIAIVYIGLVALIQPDMKKLIAYSSVAHMGFTTLGIFVIFPITANGGSSALQAMQGGYFQMISHGFISAALFMCVGVMYDRIHSRQIADYGGVVNSMPIFAALTMLFAMANAGLPGTAGFVGEFLVIIAAYQAGFHVALIAGLALILGAGYTLWMYSRVIFGDVVKEQIRQLADLSPRECLALGVPAVAVLVFGIWPQPVLEMANASLHNVLRLTVGWS